jgi:hypothetical protein
MRWNKHLMNIQVHIYDVDLLHSLLSVPFLHKVTSTSYQRTVPYPHVDDMTILSKPLSTTRKW